MLVHFRGGTGTERTTIAVRGLVGLDEHSGISGMHEPATLPRHNPFSLFIPAHRKLAARLTQVFIGTRPPCWTSGQVGEAIFHRRVRAGKKKYSGKKKYTDILVI